jgi:hypothetical protein
MKGSALLQVVRSRDGFDHATEKDAILFECCRLGSDLLNDCDKADFVRFMRAAMVAYADAHLAQNVSAPIIIEAHERSLAELEVIFAELDDYSSGDA